MTSSTVNVAVVGAGIVGMSCALWAQMRGLSVLLLDENEPGTGASFGNAGTIATYACVPINSPSIPRNLASLLLSNDSPLSVDWSYAVRNLPWMMSFLRHCSSERVEHISSSLGALLSHADAGLNPLIAEAGAEDLVVENDCLYVYSSKTAFDQAGASMATRRLHGVDFDVLDGVTIAQMEPKLKLAAHKGLLYKGARHISDPGALVKRFHQRFIANGGIWRQKKVVEVSETQGGLELHCADGERYETQRVVLAAGAHSTRIVGAGTDHIPLDTERGYHVQYGAHRSVISRPVGWAEAGLYATPMDQGLRIAGTVELAGLNKPPSAKRIAYLERRASEMFDDLGAPDQTWLGFRPTLPDALPVIGPSTKSPNIICAFGHQHVGLTLAGITGRIVADLAQDRQTNLDLAPFSSTRFQ